MDVFQIIGFGVVMFCAAIGAACGLICMFFGAAILQKQWKRGIEVSDAFERSVR